MAASWVKQTERHRRVSNQVWQATIAVDVPAADAERRTWREQAGAAPARSDFIRKIGRRPCGGSEVGKPTPQQAAHVTGT